MNKVKKGDFLVFVANSGEVTEFFVSKATFDLDLCHQGETGRKCAPELFGFRLHDGHLYSDEDSRLYWVNRKATYSERQQFLEWLELKGYKFNQNTLELIYQ